MKKKVLGMFLVATMAASVLAGCGGKAEDKSEAKKDDTAAAQEETLTVWCWDPNFNVYAMEQAEKCIRKIIRISNWISRKKYTLILKLL